MMPVLVIGKAGELLHIAWEYFVQQHKLVFCPQVYAGKAGAPAARFDYVGSLGNRRIKMDRSHMISMTLPESEIFGIPNCPGL